MAKSTHMYNHCNILQCINVHATIGGLASTSLWLVSCLEAAGYLLANNLFLFTFLTFTCTNSEAPNSVNLALHRKQSSQLCLTFFSLAQSRWRRIHFEVGLMGLICIFSWYGFWDHWTLLHFFLSEQLLFLPSSSPLLLVLQHCWMIIGQQKVDPE